LPSRKQQRAKLFHLKPQISEADRIIQGLTDLIEEVRAKKTRGAAVVLENGDLPRVFVMGMYEHNPSRLHFDLARTTKRLLD
jgi:hypothetical protein